MRHRVGWYGKATRGEICTAVPTGGTAPDPGTDYHQLHDYLCRGLVLSVIQPSDVYCQTVNREAHHQSRESTMLDVKLLEKNV